MIIDESWAQLARRRLASLQSPRALLRTALLLVLGCVWLVVGSSIWPVGLVGGVTQFDLIWPLKAGRVLLSGGDPYAPSFAQLMSGNPNDIVYPYPLASLWLTLPLLPLPDSLAAVLWVSLSIAGLASLAFFFETGAPRWTWLLPVLYYPTLYSLLITQWAAMLMIVLAVSVWLFRRGHPLWAGFILPLAAVKPTVGTGLLLMGAVLCARDRRWWAGMVLGGLCWYGLPLLIMPDWPVHWLTTLRSFQSNYASGLFLTLTDLRDGQVLFAATALIGVWCLWRRRLNGLGSALVLLVLLATPHRAHYDFPPFWMPMLFLPARWRWLALVAVASSWLFPLTFELGWSNSLQLTLFIVLPSVVACALASDERELVPAETRVPAPSLAG
jgi:hypothetical protein